jgi:hypothetical protein
MTRTAMAILACGLLCFIGTALAQISDQSGDYLGSSYGQQSTSNSYNPGSNYDWLSPGVAYYANYYWYPGPYYYRAWYPTGYYWYYPYYYSSYGPWYYYNYDPWWAANVYGPYRTTYYWWSW